MTTITFDTHKIVTQLKQAGLSEPQAEAITRAFQDVTAEAEVATKHDIHQLEGSIERLERTLRSDMREAEVATKRDIERLEGAMGRLELALRGDMREMELRLTVKLGAMLALAIGLVAAMVKLL